MEEDGAIQKPKRAPESMIRVGRQLHLSTILRNHFPSLAEHTILELAFGMTSSSDLSGFIFPLLNKERYLNLFIEMLTDFIQDNKQDMTSRVGVSKMLGKGFAKSFHYKVVGMIIDDLDSLKTVVKMQSEVINKLNEKIDLMSKIDAD